MINFLKFCRLRIPFGRSTITVNILPAPDGTCNRDRESACIWKKCMVMVRYRKRQENMKGNMRWREKDLLFRK